MAIMTHAKFHFNWLMVTLIFGIWASEPPPRAWRMTEKAGPVWVKLRPFCTKWNSLHKTGFFLLEDQLVKRGMRQKMVAVFH